MQLYRLDYKSWLIENNWLGNPEKTLFFQGNMFKKNLNCSDSVQIFVNMQNGALYDVPTKT